MRLTVAIAPPADFPISCGAGPPEVPQLHKILPGTDRTCEDSREDPSWELSKRGPVARTRHGASGSALGNSPNNSCDHGKPNGQDVKPWFTSLCQSCFWNRMIHCQKRHKRQHAGMKDTGQGKLLLKETHGSTRSVIARHPTSMRGFFGKQKGLQRQNQTRDHDITEAQPNKHDAVDSCFRRQGSEWKHQARKSLDRSLMFFGTLDWAIVLLTQRTYR